MNTTYDRFFLLVYMLCVFVSCSSPESETSTTVQVEPTEFHFPQEGGSRKFAITPGEAVSFDCSETWCQIALESQTSVQAIYRLTVEPSTDPAPRTATVTVRTDRPLQTLSVSQDAYVPKEEPEKYTIRPNLTTRQLVDEMGLGINLGNTLDAVGDWINPGSILNYEQAWGSPIVTQPLIEGYARAGFRSLRIPVSWGNLLADDFTIHPDLFDRVEKIVNWTLDAGMVAVVNIHHENTWIKQAATDEQARRKFVSIWTQISNRLEKYGDHLLFEPMNEIGFDEIWTPWKGTDADKAVAFNHVNKLNQLFVDVVRATGGNNARRHLLVEVYNTGLEYAFDPLTRIPDDPAGRLALTVHYYTPATFAILGAGEDAGWGVGQESWGTEQDMKELNDNMELLKKNCVDRGIPVIVGEYGCSSKGRTQEVVRLFLTSVTRAIYSRGMCPILWDIPGGQYNRQTFQFDDPVFLQQMMDIYNNKN